MLKSLHMAGALFLQFNEHLRCCLMLRSVQGVNVLFPFFPRFALKAPQVLSEGGTGGLEVYAEVGEDSTGMGRVERVL